VFFKAAPPKMLMARQLRIDLPVRTRGYRWRTATRVVEGSAAFRNIPIQSIKAFSVFGAPTCNVGATPS